MVYLAVKTWLVAKNVRVLRAALTSKASWEEARSKDGTRCRLEASSSGHLLGVKADGGDPLAEGLELGDGSISCSGASLGLTLFGPGFAEHGEQRAARRALTERVLYGWPRAVDQQGTTRSNEVQAWNLEVVPERPCDSGHMQRGAVVLRFASTMTAKQWTE